MANLGQLVRYIKTTEHDELELCPATKLENRECTLNIETWVDSDWAGCETTAEAPVAGPFSGAATA